MFDTEKFETLFCFFREGFVPHRKRAGMALLHTSLLKRMNLETKQTHPTFVRFEFEIALAVQSIPKRSEFHIVPQNRSFNSFLLCFKAGYISNETF